jgi:hypothetical protein
MRRFASVVASLAVLIVETAFAASIGIFSNEDCSSCTLSIGPGETRTIYISAFDAPGDVLSAYLSVADLPMGWAATAVPSPSANVAIGDPFGPNGSVLSFPKLQGRSCVLLYTVSIQASADVMPFMLRVGPSTVPSFPMLGCPALYVCDSGCDFVPPTCVAGGALLVNTSCAVSVVTASWSVVRTLYK